MANAEHDVLAYMGFPAAHRAKLHSTNPIERLDGEIKRPTDVVGIFPNEQAITRLIGAMLMEQSEEWAVQRARDMTLEPKVRAAKPWHPSAMIPSSCRWQSPEHDQPGHIPDHGEHQKLHHVMGHDPAGSQPLPHNPLI